MTRDDHHFVFAYGSNLHLEDLDRWLFEKGYADLAPREVKLATLRGARLAWDYHSPVRKGGAANVTDAEGHELPGAVLVVERELLHALDRKEGHPERYRRREELVHVEDGTLSAWVYRVTEDYRSTDPVWPRRVYLDTVIEGARRLALPDWHLANLREVPTRDD
jgi:gamma-glutamylcyclotransferase (GGCT)/AIG2-like uncharacterized protein YtfP